MRINLEEILEIANQNNCAIGAFNTPNYECINAAIRAAEELNVPVIIAHAQIHDYASPLSKIGPVMIQAAENSKVPVCVHLDHCDNFDYLQLALDLGFGGVMYDGSALPYEQNLENTKKAVSMASKYDCNVEAELGSMPTTENSQDSDPDSIYTNPEQALDFCEKTDIDALAISFGTAHGIYKSKPKLNLDLVKTISQKIKLPLVMHGGSGVSPNDFKTGIKNGLRKINYYSYMSKAGLEAARKTLKDQDLTYYHDVTIQVEQAMYQDILKAMRVFSESMITK